MASAALGDRFSDHLLRLACRRRAACRKRLLPLRRVAARHTDCVGGDPWGRIPVPPLADLPRDHCRHPAALVDRHTADPDSRWRVPGPLFPRGAAGAVRDPSGVGDVLTGIFAPVVAYWWFAGKPYARAAAIAWNLFGMADLVNAVTIGSLTGGGGGGIVFPIVLIPIYGVPRAFLIHSYSLIGLLRKTSRHPSPSDSRHYGAAPATP